MTVLLQEAFAAAAKLPEAEQELLASRLLAELSADDDFDRVIVSSAGKLSTLAKEALAEHRSGQSEPWTLSDYELAHDYLIKCKQ